MWILYEIQNSMTSYQLWDLVIKAITTIALGVGAWLAYAKFEDEKNRKNYEKRLNLLYAPLYGRVVKQELLRSLLCPEVTMQNEPILHAYNSSSDNPREEDPLLNQMDFIKVLTDENRGLARPALLKLIYQYHVLLDWQGFDNNRDKSICEKMDVARLEVSTNLINEIIDGYKKTVQKLGLDSKHSLKEIEKFNIDIN